MMEFLRTWVKDIFIIVVGLYFIEIVLPDGSMRKYIKFIFSIMILGVVISPLIHLGDLGELLGTETAGTIAAASDDTGQIDDASRLEQVQWMQMEEIYKTKIETQVKGILQGELPETEILSVEVILAEHGSQKEFGKVNKIVINTTGSEYVSSIEQHVSLGLGIEADKILVEIQETQSQATAPEGKDENG